MIDDEMGAVSGGGFIVAVVAIVIGLALLPIVTNQITLVDECTLTTTGEGVPCGTDPANETRNLTATQSTILNLIPTFYLIGMFVGVIAWLAITRRG